MNTFVDAFSAIPVAVLCALLVAGTVIGFGLLAVAHTLASDVGSEIIAVAGMRRSGPHAAPAPPGCTPRGAGLAPLAPRDDSRSLVQPSRARDARPSPAGSGARPAVITRIRYEWRRYQSWRRARERELGIRNGRIQ